LKTRFLFMLTILAGLAILPALIPYSFALSCTTTVTSGGSIEAAVAAASPGDVICVGPGTYSERVDIFTSLSLVSTSGAALTIINDPGTGGSPGYGAVGISGSHVTLGLPGQGFTIEGAKDMAGIYIHKGATHTTVEGNVILMSFPGSCFPFCEAVVTDGGVGPDIMVSGNTFNTPLGSTNTKNLLVRVNGANDPGLGFGSPSTGFSFVNNLFEGTAFQTIVLNADNSLVSGNTFQGNVLIDLYSSFTSNLQVTNNHFTSGHVSVGPCDFLSSPCSEAIGVDGNNGLTVTGNTIMGYDVGVYYGPHSNGGGLVHSNQIIGDSAYGVYNANTGFSQVVDATNNYWGSNTGPQDTKTTPDSCGIPYNNPSGTGSAVSPCVLYEPFQTQITGVPEFGSLYFAVAFGAVVYLVVSRRFGRRATISVWT
jgi:hypothetical protein